MHTKTFQDALRRAVEPRGPALVHAWHEWIDGIEGANDRFTAIWKGEDGIYSALAGHLNLNCVRETYRRVDAAYVAPDGTIALALEHENNIKTAAHEVEKLAHVNAPLNVVVTYPVTRSLLEERERCLRKFQGILTDAASTGTQLVVFGTLRGDRIEWSFHRFTGSVFIEY